MKKIRIVIISVVYLCITLISPIYTNADGSDNPAEIAQSNSISNNEIFNNVSAKSGILFETTTQTVIAEKNSNEKRQIGHLAKLMTVLITEENIKNGKLKLTDKVTASANANSQNAPQIWLNAGEKITVDELLKAITIGNANDACVALAEKIGGNESKFLSIMNKKAKQLGMKNTYFADVGGNNENTVSTAYDLALLSRELLKHNDLTEYFTTWICSIRNKATELVSTNRLIRTYKDCIGLKSCASKLSGECLISTVKRNNMVICCVLISSESDDSKFSEAKSVMDYGFTTFEIYEPELSNEILKKIDLNNGEQLYANVKLNSLHNVLIPRGTYKQITCDFNREESVSAPVKKGQKIGTVTFKNDKEVILKSDIVIADDIRKIGVLFAFKKLLLNLLYM